MEICETLTTFFSSGTKRLLTSFFFTFNFSFFSSRKERDTIFTMLTVPTSFFSPLPSWTLSPESKSQLTDPTNARAPCSPQTGLASSSFKSQLASSSFKSQLTAFFKNHQNSQPIASGHDVIHTPVSLPIWGFYYDICDCHILRERSWTVLNVCSCTCTKPSSSKPNQTEW